MPALSKRESVCVIERERETMCVCDRERENAPAGADRVCGRHNECA